MLTTDYFSNEPIPTCGNGLDEPGLFGVVVENGAQLANAPGQGRAIDYDIRPGALKSSSLVINWPGRSTNGVTFQRL